MAEYKDTLNLPNTTFPMKANLAQREPQFLTAWQAQDLYHVIREKRKDAPRFILHDGPPYANGHLHCGHALNKILKDIVVKAKTLSGYDAAFVPGWDCHGLPIELNVERKIGKAGVKIDATTFRAKCREYAASQIDIQREEFQRLGVFGDWQNPYTTFDYHYEANILRALAKIIENGHLQQGFKPVHWCIECGSALAEAEVEYEEKISPSIDVAFYASNPQDIIERIDTILEIKPVIVPIWTTTPWTLPGNEAVCLHADVAYELVDTQSHYFLIAASLVNAIMQRYEISDYKRCGQAKGSQFLNIKVEHPFAQRQVPLVLGEHVAIDSGTGCVHTAPAHGPEDYEIGRQFDLPLINPVMTNGCYAPDVPFFANQFILQANDSIVQLLQEKNVLLHADTIRHSYPHCWRHKTPMIFLATAQWFIAMDTKGLRQAVLKKIDEVAWLPDWGKARIRGMVETRPDWCISRQRAWGTPIPLLLHKETKQLHPNTCALIEQVAQRVEKTGINAWFDLELKELLGDEADQYVKVNDTLDVWFDAGVSHYAVLKENPSLGFPADMYLEGSDQHRGWFNSALTTSVAIDEKAPYRAVLTHGYTVDAEGKKLSKSKGNYVSLDKLINQHGADVLRLWVASVDYRNEVSISEEIIHRNADAYRRIRNTARFLLANLFDFVPHDHEVSERQLIELDRWIIKRAQDIQCDVIAAYDSYNFHIIYQKIHNFCVVDLSSFYLDVIKDRQYTTPKNSLARRSCQTAIYHILQAFTRWLTPIISFTADEIWQYIPGRKQESLFVQTWYEGWPSIKTKEHVSWLKLQMIRDEVNKVLETTRQQGVIGSGLAAEVTIYMDVPLQKELALLGDELRFVLITSKATIKPWCEKPDGLPINQELGVAIAVEASVYEKCQRCWHRQESVGQNNTFIDLCDRCIQNLSGNDEVRRFA